MPRNSLRTVMLKTRFFQSVKKFFLSFWKGVKVPIPPNPFTFIVLPYFLYILLSFAVYSLGVEHGNPSWRRVDRPLRRFVVGLRRVCLCHQ